MFDFLHAFDALPPTFPHGDAAAEEEMRARFRTALAAKRSPATTAQGAAQGNGSGTLVIDFGVEAALKTVVTHVKFQTISGPSPKWQWFMGEITQLIAAHQAFVQKSATFRCYLCADGHAPMAEAVTLSSCGHRFSRPCFKRYLEEKIQEGNAFPVCFHPLDNKADADGAIPRKRTCNVQVSEPVIYSVVDAEVAEEYREFRSIQPHEYGLQQCPYCAHPQECAGGPQAPVCGCEQCGKTFCFVHGKAHASVSCGDYELANAASKVLGTLSFEQAMEQATTTKATTKPCPGCKSDVEKRGDCNHMICEACETSFCWLCEQVVENVSFPPHFKLHSGSSCGGRLFDECSDVWDICRTLLSAAGLVMLYTPACVVTLVKSVLYGEFLDATKPFSARVQDTLSVGLDGLAYSAGRVAAIFLMNWKLFMGLF